MVATHTKSKPNLSSLHPWEDENHSECGGNLSLAFIVGAVGGALERSAQGSRLNRRVVERDVTKRFEEVFEAFAQDSAGFHDTFMRAFSGKYDYHSIEAIRCRAVLGHWDFLPVVKIVAPDVLRGGYGAYAPRTHTMYLSEGVALANAGLAVEVMIELMGMHILNLTRSYQGRGGSDELPATSSIIVGGVEIAVNFYVGALCTALT